MARSKRSRLDIYEYLETIVSFSRPSNPVLQLEEKENEKATTISDSDHGSRMHYSDGQPPT